MWQDPNYAEKVKVGLKSEANLRAHTSDEFRKKQSENAKQQMKDSSQLACRSEAMKKSWETGKIEYHQVVLPNFSKIELAFGDLLCESLGDNKSELVRHFKIERDDKPKHYYCPDYKYKNFIIEVDGDYWHARNVADDEVVHHGITAKEIRDTDAKKTQLYESKGFTVIRVWTSEFKAHPDDTIRSVMEQIQPS